MRSVSKFRKVPTYLRRQFVMLAVIVFGGVNASAQDIPAPSFQSGLPDPVPDVFNLVDFLDEFGGFPRHAVGKLDTIELGNGAYVVTEGVYQAFFLVGRRGVILVDAPPSLGVPGATTQTGETLLGAIAAVTDRPIRHLVYSHEHKDHIAGAAAIRDAFPYVRIHSSKETLGSLVRAHAQDSNDSRPLPNRIVHHKSWVRSGRQVVQLSDRGTAHSPGDLYIWAPRQKILMLVDVVFPKWVPFSSLALTDDVRGYINAHDQILAFPFETFIGGHLTRLGGRDDVEKNLEYVLAVRDAAGAALGTVGFGDISDETAVMSDADAFVYFQNPFALFDEFLQDVTQVCADIVESDERFASMAALDVFTASHCFTMQNSLRLD